MRVIVAGKSLQLVARDTISGDYVIEAEEIGINTSWEAVRVSLGIDLDQCHSDQRHLIAQVLHAIADDIEGPVLENIAHVEHLLAELYTQNAPDKHALRGTRQVH